jgi:glycosyltransferase involved in cell wall biosynthesis
VVTRADDNLLSSYYEGALFTIFPTLSEGWGFPVAESLMFGKACVASNVDSLREVGGDLVCYVDPHDLEEIYDRVRILIVNDDERARWEDRIRSEYRRRTWEATASSFLQHLAGEPPARAENDVSSRGSRE